MLMVESVLNTMTYLSAFILTYFSVFLILVYFDKKEYIQTYKGKKVWEPTVSVVIPCYNEEKEIGKCIQSVLNSNYPKEKLQIIVVDDCSKDNSFQEAKKYESKGVIVCQTPKNTGCAAGSKNYGVKLATGEILGFLDSDSFVEPDTLRKMLPFFEERDVGSVTPSVRILNPKNIMEQFQCIEYEVVIFLRRLLMAIDAVYVTPGPFSLFTREAFEETGGFDESSITEDHEIALSIQSKGYKIKSTFDANVHTIPPNTIPLWIMQRTRWLRGGVYNRWKYKYLINLSKWGDFGFMALTLDMILIIPIMMLLITPILRFLLYDHWMERIGLLSVFYSVDALWYIGFAISVISILWLYNVWSTMKNYAPKYKISWYIWPSYLFVYGISMSYVWLFVIWKEITRQKKGWDTR
ncbi:glycosyltransferase family 2 protein [Candidatus Micrarchaeota archaeon]|nr:glycosyltransferase family 2 protein [Candidatus Micrarchaeota archaeon]